jgi:hypothetical protein
MPWYSLVGRTICRFFRQNMPESAGIYRHNEPAQNPFLGKQ